MAATMRDRLRRPRGGAPNRKLVLDYRDDLRVFPSRWHKAGLLLLAFLYWYLPTQAFGATGTRVMTLVGIYAIGAIGLNLLIGYCGQVSLGHAFFIGVGSYTAGHLGVTHGWPFAVYLPAAILLGFALGGVIGPFALRLRGNYLVVVTLGLVFLGRHVFKNWDSVTGGNRGFSIRGADLRIGPLDFAGLQVFGQTFNREQSLFFLVWALVAVTAVVAKNLVRGRMGRAMQAVRDRDLSAEIIGVHLARIKVGAFAWSSAIACASGVLTGLYFRNATPDSFGIFESITFVAIIIIGGVGTIFGSIVGAFFVIGGQELIRQNSSSALLSPLLGSGRHDGLMNATELSIILFGAFIVLFLLFEPRGLAALWFRFKIWLMTWPFSY